MKLITIVAMLASLVGASAAQASSGPFIIVGSYGHNPLAVKPTRVCPTNRTCITGVHWSKWGSRAIGRGKAKTCAPGGVACTTATITVTYSKVLLVCGADPVYTRVSFRFPGGPLIYKKIDPFSYLNPKWGC